MKKETKIELFDQIMNVIAFHSKEEKQLIPKNIGVLNKRVTQIGFKPLEIGTPVFEFQDRYLLFFETLNGDKSCEIRYYKEPHPGYEKWALKNMIDFINF